jgi:hypothetical protein
MHTSRPILLAFVLTGLIALPAFAAPEKLTPEERQALEQEARRLQEQIYNALPLEDDDAGDRFADAVVFHKGVTWALRYDTEFEAKDVALLKKALARGKVRARALAAKRSQWPAKKGRVVRGYLSSVDASTQPYGLIIPESYDPAKPMRLDVVLHGSTRPVGLSELRFMDRFDEGDTGGQQVTGRDYIELHPLGRVENCYRWAGETDVFEAIDAVCRNYNIDRDRIVLRGMSMGASGTWHLGLKHPDQFVALGPYCGYVDTHRFSETPLANFVKVGPLPPHQELGLHMLDSVDYAANAGVVPAIACMGEKDVFFQAHVIMGDAMKKEGLEMVNLISPGTGHTIDPVTHAEQMRRIGEYAARGLDHAPRKLRFVTWTLKYADCHWLRVLGLEEHYARAELAASVADDGTVEVSEPRNITRFAIRRPMLQRADAKLRIAGKEVALPALGAADEQRVVTLIRDGNDWRATAAPDSPLHEDRTKARKRPGVQGPIDDAFTSRFICVRGTGEPWNPAVHAWSEANLNRFAYEWSRYFRGNLPIRKDTDVTDEDRQTYNLILFGDPGSNRLIAEVLPLLPLKWTKDELVFDGQRYPAQEHAPALVFPNPLATVYPDFMAGRYVVINSGHTFHEAELNKLNYLLFPRLGDWAIFKVGDNFKVGDKAPASPSDPLDETVLRAGFFNENWQPK